MRISEQHRQFIEAFTEDTPELLLFAVRTSGFKGNDTYLRAKGKQFLMDPMIVKGIQERDKYRESRDSRVATRLEREVFLSEIMRNKDAEAQIKYDAGNTPKPPEDIPLVSRMKAAETLSRMQGDFIEKIDISGNISITDIITKSHRIGADEDEDSLEAIETEYYLIQEQDAKEDAEKEAEKNKEVEVVVENKSSLNNFL